MDGPFPGVPYSFGALRQTFGPLFVRCDVCRHYARLYLAEIRDTDSRTKTFSCCRCGTDGALAITEPRPVCEALRGEGAYTLTRN